MSEPASSGAAGLAGWKAIGGAAGHRPMAVAAWRLVALLWTKFALERQ